MQTVLAPPKARRSAPSKVDEPPSYYDVQPDPDDPDILVRVDAAGRSVAVLVCGEPVLFLARRDSGEIVPFYPRRGPVMHRAPSIFRPDDAA